MATPISYHVTPVPGAGMGGSPRGFPPFTAGSDANAVSVAQQLATMYQVSLYVIRTDNNTVLNGGAALTPASPGSALGNQVTGVGPSTY